MNENDIIITEITNISRGGLKPGRPFVPTRARTSHAIGFVLKGNFEYQAENTKFVVRQDEIFFIRAGYVDYSSAFECDHTSFITVDFKTLNSNFELGCPIKLDKQTEAALALFKQIYSVWLTNAPRFKMKCIGLLYDILNFLPDNAYGEQTFSTKYSKIAPAIIYLNKHYSDPKISASELANACMMSESNLNRLMRELYGCTTSGFIRYIRIQNAMNLLENLTNRVSEVASSVGYSDVYSFSHAFKLTTGYSPSDWRFSLTKNGTEDKNKA